MTRVGVSVMLFGLVGLLGGYFYTSGTLAYKYVGLGEAFISVLMGPLMVVGGFFVQTGRIDGFPLLLSLPLGLLVGSVTLANNLRDVADDRRARIVTLPMRMGVRAVKRLYYAMLTAPFAIVLATVAVLRSYLPLLLVVLSVPSAVRAIDRMRTAGDTHEDIRARAAERAYPLNSIRLHLRFGLLLILGCGMSALLATIGTGGP
jgi:1,4-dihydroxy-2-naphthoate octaprenyltransferase